MLDFSSSENTEPTNTLDGSEGNDHLLGTPGNDLILGFGGNDILRGEGGSDALIGGDGNDRIDGGGGNDLVDGGLGNDMLVGNAGHDTLVGGAGADEFRLSSAAGGPDEVLDFNPTEDILRIYVGPVSGPTAGIVEVNDWADGSGADVLYQGVLQAAVPGGANLTTADVVIVRPSP